MLDRHAHNIFNFSGIADGLRLSDLLDLVFKHGSVPFPLSRLSASAENVPDVVQLRGRTGVYDLVRHLDDTGTQLII